MIVNNLTLKHFMMLCFNRVYLVIPVTVLFCYVLNHSVLHFYPATTESAFIDVQISTVFIVCTSALLSVNVLKYVRYLMLNFIQLSSQYHCWAFVPQQTSLIFVQNVCAIHRVTLT